MLENVDKSQNVSEFLKYCDNFAEFWQNFDGILMFKDSNDTVAREPNLSSTLAKVRQSAAIRKSKIDVCICHCRQQGWKIRFPSDRIIRIFEHQNSMKILSESSKIITIFQKFSQILGLLNIF